MEDEDERRRRDARIIPVDSVCALVRSAEQASQAAPRPVATLLPVEPLRSLPAETLNAAMQRRVGSLNPYQISLSRFDIALLNQE